MVLWSEKEWERMRKWQEIVITTPRHRIVRQTGEMSSWCLTNNLVSDTQGVVLRILLFSVLPPAVSSFVSYSYVNVSHAPAKGQRLVSEILIKLLFRDLDPTFTFLLWYSSPCVMMFQCYKPTGFVSFLLNLSTFVMTGRLILTEMFSDDSSCWSCEKRYLWVTSLPFIKRPIEMGSGNETLSLWPRSSLELSHYTCTWW